MRIAFNIALIISLLYLPWWVGALIVIAGCIVARRFYEVMFYGILADGLYATKYGLYGFTHVAALYTLVVFLIASTVQKRLA